MDFDASFCSTDTAETSCQLNRRCLNCVSGIVVATTYCCSPRLIGLQGITQTSPTRQFRQTQMGHACEWETSMMLRIQPQLVGEYAATTDVEWGRAFVPANRAWVTPDRSPLGHIGYPKEASADKGETLFRVFAAGVVALLEPSSGMAKNGTHEPFPPALLEMVGLPVAAVCHHAAVHGSANVVPDRNPHEAGVPSGRRAIRPIGGCLQLGVRRWVRYFSAFLPIA